MNTTPANKDFFSALETSHMVLQDNLRDLFTALERLKANKDLLLGKYDLSKILDGLKQNPEGATFSDAAEELKRCCWRSTIDRTKIHELMTESLKDEFNKTLKDTVVLPFSSENLYGVLGSLYDKRAEIMVEACRRVFGQFTDYSFWHWRQQNGQGNRETWKTNSPDKVGEKVIIPGVVDRWSWNNNGKTEYTYRVEYNRREKMLDIDRVLGWLSGKRLGEVKELYETISETLRNGEFKGESEFFTFKLFKKGTCHLLWKDKALLESFNLVCFQGEMGLPSSFRKPE